MLIRCVVLVFELSAATQLAPLPRDTKHFPAQRFATIHSALRVVCPSSVSQGRVGATRSLEPRGGRALLASLPGQFT